MSSSDGGIGILGVLSLAHICCGMCPVDEDGLHSPPCPTNPSSQPASPESSAVSASPSGNGSSDGATVEPSESETTSE